MNLLNKILKTLSSIFTMLRLILYINKSDGRYVHILKLYSINLYYIFNLLPNPLSIKLFKSNIHIN